jgi:hypothetical protein
MGVLRSERLLYRKLTEPRISARLHVKILEYKPPSKLSEVAAIGLDTNILKALRRNAPLADMLSVVAESHDTALITPYQCVTEYWNNHKVFANDEWTKFRTDLGKLTKHIETARVTGHDERRVLEIERLVNELSDDLEAEQSPEYLTRSKTLIASLLEYASVPMVSRQKFATLASVRSASKLPPGFADEKTKVSSLGDFFAWCDFLLGALCVVDPQSRNQYLFVTDETKADWKTGTGGHPMLIEEFELVTDGQLSIVSLDDLRALLESDGEEDRASSDRSLREELGAGANNSGAAVGD